MLKVIPLMEKYRPRSLSDMVGQESSVSVLQHDIREDAIKPLYIMHGTFGTGKTTAARAFARDYNCPNRAEGVSDGCGECENCVGNTSRHTIEINATEYSSVDSIRELLRNLRMGGSGRRRFVILDEAHHMSTQAMDTLLKTTEDPNTDYTFILVTSEKNKIRQGLISRASMIFMQPIDNSVIVDRLSFICKNEGISNVSHETIVSCANRANGSMRTAINHLERAIISEDEVSDSDDKWDSYMDAMSSGDISQALVAVADLVESDYTPMDVVNRSFVSVRDALVQGEDMWAGGLARYAIAEFAKAVQTMNSSGSDRIALEAAVVSIINPPHRDVELQVKNAVQRALGSANISEVASSGVATSSTQKAEKSVERETMGGKQAQERTTAKESTSVRADKTTMVDKRDEGELSDVEKRKRVKEDVENRGGYAIARELVENSGIKASGKNSVENDSETFEAIKQELIRAKKKAIKQDRQDVLELFSLVTDWEEHGDTLTLYVDIDEDEEDEYGDYKASAFTRRFVAKELDYDSVVVEICFDDYDY